MNNMRKNCINKHISIGRLGERLVSDHYSRCGYRTIASNIVRPYGEVDRVVSRENEVRFIEVKSRVIQSYDTWVSCGSVFKAEYAVSREKRKKLKKIIEVFLADPFAFHVKQREWESVHVDIVSVTFLKGRGYKIKILKDIEL
jgi:Holliday junction resolvase-like predicted endonuclease